MKKRLTTAILLFVIAAPTFAQSTDPDLGTGNIVPLARNQSSESAYDYRRAYAFEPYAGAYAYETPRSYLRARHGDNNWRGATSAPGASVEKDDTR